ncbi:sigma-70 family RNA polymerase sigma factor [Singulisphaera sp. Ch08]|uniref:Sigma-70 family RNA polymerase sigma factor n=1 Tax=Singulisphaera sp. Ch08 TaxID=3120278 RepID=A0AAU7CKE0_9BACT
MTDLSEHRLERLIERLRRGEDQARHALLALVHERLRRLAGVRLHRDFPPLRDRHDADSVLHEAWPRLIKALKAAPPPTAADFFRLTAHKINQVLLDMLDRQQVRDRRERASGTVDTLATDISPLARSSEDPARQLALSEVHRFVDELPPEERAVFKMHYYQDLTQAEIAPLLGKTPRQVSYLWVAAAGRLAGRLGGTHSL